MRAEILYEDKDILVVKKPAGLAVQTARIGSPDMESELKNHLALEAGREGNGREKAPYLGVVHRLDQPVEGVLVFAKNKNAAAGLSKQLQEGNFCKEYLAVVAGCPAKAEDVLEDYLIKTGSRAQVCALGPDGTLPGEAQRARLCYRVEQRADTGAGELALLRIELETGRFHQIRAQLSHRGFPILGDAKYQDDRAAKMAAALGIRFAALCAVRLNFLHPGNGRKLEYTVSPENPAFSFFLL